MVGLSVAGRSKDERADVLIDVVEGFGSPRLGLVLVDVDPTPQAWVAAFEASGRDRSVLGIFEAGLPSRPGLSVRNILPFFSGDGVRDFFSPAVSGANVDALLVLARSFSRIEPVPELFRGAITGRRGRGGGRDRSVYSIGGIEPPPSQLEEPSVPLDVTGTP
jgi:hypothetical protein